MKINIYNKKIYTYFLKIIKKNLFYKIKQIHITYSSIIFKILRTIEQENTNEKRKKKCHKRK